MANDHGHRCPICDSTTSRYDVGDHGERYQIKCPCCGEFRITRTAAALAQNERIGTPLSAWVRDRFEQGVEIPEIDRDALQEIRKSFPSYRTSDKQLLLMRAIERLTNYPGEFVWLTPDYDYPLAWAALAKEFFYHLDSLMARRLIDRRPGVDERGGPARLSVALTPEGWDFLDSHARTSIISNQAFVAMSFAPELKPAWESAIFPTLDRAGFKGYRVDVDPHIDKIDTKIMAEIKNSRFLVADVTQQRPGVYFEAGYALGLGIPVFWSVRKDDLDNVHFDTRQYHHILWESEAELADKLYHLVYAIVGKGPGR